VHVCKVSRQGKPGEVTAQRTREAGEEGRAEDVPDGVKGALEVRDGEIKVGDTASRLCLQRQPEAADGVDGRANLSRRLTEDNGGNDIGCRHVNVLLDAERCRVRYVALDLPELAELCSCLRHAAREATPVRSLSSYRTA
jgi:hypothetical protein